MRIAKLTATFCLIIFLSGCETISPTAQTDSAALQDAMRKQEEDNKKKIEAAKKALMDQALRDMFRIDALLSNPETRQSELKKMEQNAAKGNLIAQNFLGSYYEQGKYEPQNYAEAMRWYKLAAAQGSKFAQRRIGLMYENGNGVAQNYREAAQWYKLAATEVVGYGATVRACVQRGVAFLAPSRTTTNPSVQYRVGLRDNGIITDVKLLKSSGNLSFDSAVERGIKQCDIFPVPPSGKYPRYVDIDYKMYD